MCRTLLISIFAIVRAINKKATIIFIIYVARVTRTCSNTTVVVSHAHIVYAVVFVAFGA